MAQYRVRGSYFESCNCEPICPCRTIGGRRGGRSTHGICFGTLSWHVAEGHAAGIDVSGLLAALVYRYSDDKEGSPWTFVLHVDERGGGRQRAALADVLLGRLGGLHIETEPWVRKPGKLLEVRSSAIELAPDGAGYRLRIGDSVCAAASRAFETDETVACIVPGYERGGVELHGGELAAHDPPFEWDLTDTCAFASDFDYLSD